MTETTVVVPTETTIDAVLKEVPTAVEITIRTKLAALEAELKAHKVMIGVVGGVALVVGILLGHFLHF